MVDDGPAGVFLNGFVPGIILMTDASTYCIDQGTRGVVRIHDEHGILIVKPMKGIDVSLSYGNQFMK